MKRSHARNLLLAAALTFGAGAAHAQQFQMLEWASASYGDESVARTPVRYGVFATAPLCEAALKRQVQSDVDDLFNLPGYTNPYDKGIVQYVHDGVCVPGAPSTNAGQSVFTLTAYFQNPRTGAITIRDLSFQESLRPGCEAVAPAVVKAFVDFLAGAIFYKAACN